MAGPKHVCFKPTADDWRPNFPEDQVEVALIPNTSGWTVAVSGADDMLCNKGHAVYQEALEVFLYLLSLPRVNMTQCREVGLEF